MEQNEFMALLEEALEIAPGGIGLSDRLADHDWDSLAVLGFISAVDTKLNVTLDAAKLAEAATPADLFTLVNDAVSG